MHWVCLRWRTLPLGLATLLRSLDESLAPELAIKLGDQLVH